jgi:hypothetical protein
MIRYKRSRGPEDERGERQNHGRYIGRGDESRRRLREGERDTGII